MRIIGWVGCFYSSNRIHEVNQNYFSHLARISALADTILAARESLSLKKYSWGWTRQLFHPSAMLSQLWQGMP